MHFRLENQPYNQSIQNASSFVPLHKSQIKLAAEVLARAFQNDLLWVYFFLNASERPNKSLHVLRMLVHYAVSYGEVHATSTKLEGIAVWLPSVKAEVSPWRMIQSGGLTVMLKMNRGELLRTIRYTKYATSIHERCADMRHWYLQFIGIDPAFQGKGYASVLLKPMLAKMDADQTSCYLETHNRENVPIYQHYGFRVVEEGKSLTPSLAVGLCCDSGLVNAKGRYCKTAYLPPLLLLCNGYKEVS